MFPSILIVALLLIVVYRFAIKGKIGNFSTGVGNARATSIAWSSDSLQPA